MNISNGNVYTFVYSLLFVYSPDNSTNGNAGGVGLLDVHSDKKATLFFFFMFSVKVQFSVD